MLKISTKSDPGFQSGLLDVCWICPKMLWIHYLVDIRHFANFRKNRVVTMRNANKSPKIPCSAVVRKMEN